MVLREGGSQGVHRGTEPDSGSRVRKLLFTLRVEGGRKLDSSGRQEVGAERCILPGKEDTGKGSEERG